MCVVRLFIINCSCWGMVMRTCPSRNGLVSQPSDNLTTSVLRKDMLLSDGVHRVLGTQLENAEEARVAAPARFSIRASLTLRSRWTS